MRHHHLFIHPLLGTDDTWQGFLAECPPGAELAPLLHRLPAGGGSAAAPWFGPAQPGASSSPYIPVFLPPLADDLAAQAAERRESKRPTALVALPGEPLPATGQWDHVLIDISYARSPPPFTLLGLSSRTQLIATRVLSTADRQWAFDNACRLGTTEYLQQRAGNGDKPETNRLKLLELLSLIANDADTKALEAIFRQETKLAYSLLRLVNSAALAPRSPITSFSQAINLLGRRQLQRWLQLLVYADPNQARGPSPLLLKAASRGRLLETLSAAHTELGEVADIGDIAFMTGAFSLLDALLNLPMTDILKQLPLPALAAQALLDQSGPLGRLLAGTRAADARDLGAASDLFGGLGITPAELLDAQLDALSWAASIRSVD